MSKWTSVLFRIALISSWLTFIFPFYFIFVTPITFTIWAVILAMLFVRESKLRWYLIALSAWTVIPGFNFFTGTKDYFIGHASLEFVGLPGPEFYNLDKDYRLHISTSGCIESGFEPLTQWPNNGAVKLWTNLLGYQRDVYHGVYPDKNEAEKILALNGREVDILKLEPSFSFTLNNKVHTIIRQKKWNAQKIDGCKTAKVALVNNELVIMKPVFCTDLPVIYLADNKSGEIFATYYEFANSCATD
jgi:hypothetical protein